MNKKVIITIVILVLLVIGLGGYIAYDKIYLNYFNEESAKTTINEVTLDVNDLFEVGKVLEKLDNAYGDNNSTYFGYLYDLKKRVNKVSELGKDELTYAAIHDEIIFSGTEQKLPATKVKNNMNEMFGSNTKYNEATITAGTSYIFNYDDVTKSYIYTVPVLTTIYSPTYIVRNISTSVEDGKIIITRKAFYVEYERSGDGTYTSATIYKSKNKNNKLITLSLKNGLLSVDEVFAKTSSKMNTYIYTFTEDVGGYKLYQIERK